MDKSRILEAIRQTAAKHSGRALGIDRFREETGIRKEDWYGIYWAKWSDALKEAGLEPNRFGAPAFDEEWMLNQIARYSNELGHLPTKPEIRLKKREDSEFPSETAIRNRLGNKRELASKLIAYCETEGGFEVVAQACREYLNTPDTTLDQEEGDPAIGHVYLLRHSKAYKIGRSSDASRRYKAIRTQMPYKTEEVHVIETDDPVGIESYWHNRFKDKRLEGEWFQLSVADIRAFKKRRFM